MQRKPVTEVPRTFFFSPVKNHVNNGKYFLCHFFLFSTKHTNVEMKFQLPENFFFFWYLMTLN